ncbi:hypothetical protein ACFL2C_03890 [Patescibacteria group bacterium]
MAERVYGTPRPLLRGERVETLSFECGVVRNRRLERTHIFDARFVLKVDESSPLAIPCVFSEHRGRNGLLIGD